jgi:hypothetical protein
VQKLREKIAEQDHNATGALSASVEARAVELADRWRIEVLANDYGENVNNGRLSILEKPGQKRPPIQAIYEWLKVRNIGAELATESKRRGLAFAIATSIREKGIPPHGGYSRFYAKGNSIERTGFADRVIEENAPQIEATIAELMGKVADWIIFNQYKNTIKHLNK